MKMKNSDQAMGLTKNAKVLRALLRMYEVNPIKKIFNPSVLT